MQTSNSLSAVHPRRLHARSTSSQLSASSLPDADSLSSLSTSRSFQNSLSGATSAKRDIGGGDGWLNLKHQQGSERIAYWTPFQQNKRGLIRVAKRIGAGVIKWLRTPSYLRSLFIAYSLVSLVVFTLDLKNGKVFGRDESDVNSGS